MATQPDPELLTEYKTRVISALREKHGYKNIHEIPKVSKVVINTSIGAGADSKEALEIARQEIGLITGQRPITTISKKAIANFKLRQGGSQIALERTWHALRRQGEETGRAETRGAARGDRRSGRLTTAK